MRPFLWIVLVSTLFISCDPSALEGIIRTPAKTPLTKEEVTRGLKEALKVGSDNAIRFIGTIDGFNKNPRIRIPFPPEAERVKTFALQHGLQQQVEQFETNLNRAAEKAAKEALPVFTKAINDMTIEDAFAILNGDSTSATAYLRRTTTTELTARFSPIVQQAIDEVRLTSLYQPLATAYNTAALLTGEKQVDPDLNAFVTGKALNGLFYYISQEEKKIRRDPAARVSDILRRVFGSVQ